MNLKTAAYFGLMFMGAEIGFSAVTIIIQHLFKGRLDLPALFILCVSAIFGIYGYKRYRRRQTTLTEFDGRGWIK